MWDTGHGRWPGWAGPGTDQAGQPGTQGGTCGNKPPRTSTGCWLRAPDEPLKAGNTPNFRPWTCLLTSAVGRPLTGLWRVCTLRVEHTREGHVFALLGGCFSVPPPSAPACNSARLPRAPSPAAVSGTALSYQIPGSSPRGGHGGDHGVKGHLWEDCEAMKGVSTQVFVRRPLAAHGFLSKADTSGKGRCVH